MQDEAYVTNAVTEIALADNARVNHIRVQRDSMAGISHRKLRGIARARKPLSLGQRRAWRTYFAL